MHYLTLVTLFAIVTPRSLKEETMLFGFHCLTEVMIIVSMIAFAYAAASFSRLILGIILGVWFAFGYLEHAGLGPVDAEILFWLRLFVAGLTLLMVMEPLWPSKKHTKNRGL